MPYVDLRLTPKYAFDDPDIDEAKGLARARTLCKLLVQHLIPSKYIIAYEKTNRYLEPTHPHLHLAMYTEEDVKKDTLQTWVRRNLNIKGKQAYCLRVHADVDDEERYFRYCLKERYIQQVGFTEEEIEDMKDRAQDEKRRNGENALKARQKYEDRNVSFREQMYRDLDTGDIDEPDIAVAIVQYYREHKRIPPYKNMKEQVLDYRVHKGYLDVKDWYIEKYVRGKL